MNWQQFREAAPELAALGEQRIEPKGLVLVGTLRPDGWARISPVEPYIVDGELLLGMMWRSQKALDLRRDPRVTVHSVVSDREGREGDFKLYGRAVEITDRQLRDRLADATEARIDWRPEDPYHAFAVDIESASFVIFAPEAYALAWDPHRGLRRQKLPTA